jgi:hypothetical protein
MDFSNRNTQPQAAATGAHTAAAGAPSGGKKSKSRQGKLTRIALVVATLLMAILLIALIVLAINAPGKKESSFVDSSKLQAVFLNTGQVYFGNVTTMNSKYFVLTNIYYLQTATGANQSANSSVSLVKLGCELHEPYDKMVINRDQVTFWENLQDGGQVATAVKTFEKQNPEGQKCADQSASAGTTSGSATQNAGTNNATGTGARE